MQIKIHSGRYSKKFKKKPWVWYGAGCALLIVLIALSFWYEPWRFWQTGNVMQGLESSNTVVRQKAFTELSAWGFLQRQQFLEKSQTELILVYEHAINTAVVKGEWREAQLWLNDLQRLYPELPSVQLGHQKVSGYLAQQINIQVTEINRLLSAHRFLTPAHLADLSSYEEQLQTLSPDNALIYDKRILYALVFSIDEALAVEDFKLANTLLAWGMQHYPDSSELADRQVQLAFQLNGRPAEVLASCISFGKNCWHITRFSPLFSYPWVVQHAAEHPWLLDWSMGPIVQFELGSYYRREALQAYAQQQLMQASVDLLKASYFNSPEELDEYWQWLAYAFIEREQKEYKAAEQAELSALQHTLLTQIAALDLVGAQNTVVMMQTMGVDPWFIDHIALPMLGDAYLKTVQQLASSEQYELAMQVLMAGEQFLPQEAGIQQLLAEYKSTMPNNSSSSYETETTPWEVAEEKALGFERPTLLPAKQPEQDACSMKASYTSGIYTCQDELSAQAKGPLLIVPPKTTRLATAYAIGKYPISIREYNYYCHTTKACTPKSLPGVATKPKSVAKNRRGQIDLSDVQDVIEDYDNYCRSAGTCSSQDPHAQDLPVTGISLKEAANYMNWLSKVTGYTYRLPTVAEWQYAILSDETYRCTSHTLTRLPSKLVPVQQGYTNRWGIVHELNILREWVQAQRQIGTIGTEYPDHLPVCSLPVETDEASQKASPQTGFRVVREI